MLEAKLIAWANKQKGECKPPQQLKDTHSPTLSEQYMLCMTLSEQYMLRLTVHYSKRTESSPSGVRGAGWSREGRESKWFWQKSLPELRAYCSPGCMRCSQAEHWKHSRWNTYTHTHTDSDDAAHEEPQPRMRRGSPTREQQRAHADRSTAASPAPLIELSLWQLLWLLSRWRTSTRAMATPVVHCVASHNHGKLTWDFALMMRSEAAMCF